ncbi:hypothetical protein [Halalkaliarchaeum sp. AArc-CO]|uniref:hypothetical protein n=1 Tax=Halalkaliarchaeum sp. AArc-CO TaxID=2866381 RepID=UPI00217E0285|nr:hypothetical protein [Halalkaliarchaeum sp. AArc-CO]
MESVGTRTRGNPDESGNVGHRPAGRQPDRRLAVVCDNADDALATLIDTRFLECHSLGRRQQRLDSQLELELPHRERRYDVDPGQPRRRGRQRRHRYAVAPQVPRVVVEPQRRHRHRPAGYVVNVLDDRLNALALDCPLPGFDDDLGWCVRPGWLVGRRRRGAGLRRGRRRRRRGLGWGRCRRGICRFVGRVGTPRQHESPNRG